MRPGLYFVRTGIGRELRILYSDMLSAAIPERMTELLKQLDRPTEDSEDTDEA